MKKLYVLDDSNGNLAKNRDISTDITGNYHPCLSWNPAVYGPNSDDYNYFTNPNFFCYQLTVVLWQGSKPIISLPFPLPYVAACARADG